MICSSEKRFFTSNLLVIEDWTPNRFSTRSRGGVGPTVAYAANGNLGQYLVIVPEKRLVAVRLIHRRDIHAAPLDDYASFTADVLKVANTLQ